MADEGNAKDLGGGSPGSKEAQEQNMAGASGSRASQTPGVQAQPEQGSNRSPSARHDQEAEVRRSFEPGHAPSEQGEKEHPSPHVIAQHQQGMKPRSGSHMGQSDRSEEEAQRGEPEGEHSRHGRQNVSGNRPDHR